MELSQVKDHFLRDVSGLEMRVIQDTGSHRHISFSRSLGRKRYNQFDLIAWPGHLCISGDCSTYVFSRVTDMFGFFRQSDLKINPGYWAEKVLAESCNEGIKEYSHDIFCETVIKDIERYIKSSSLSVEQIVGLNEGVRQELIEGGFEDEIRAHDAVNYFGFYDPGLFQDFGEHDLKDFTYKFIW